MSAAFASPFLSTPALPGTWKLAAGRALMLQSRVDAVLRAAHGGLWITLDAPHEITPGHTASSTVSGLGDHFLAAGEAFTVPAGRQVVIEPWAPSGVDAAAGSYFTWDAVAAVATPPVRSPDRWQLGVAQPLRDVRAGLGLVGAALARLAVGVVWGLGGLAADLAAGRVRLAGTGPAFRADKAHCSAN